MGQWQTLMEGSNIQFTPEEQKTIQKLVDLLYVPKGREMSSGNWVQVIRAINQWPNAKGTYVMDMLRSDIQEGFFKDQNKWIFRWPTANVRRSKPEIQAFVSAMYVYNKYRDVLAALKPTKENAQQVQQAQLELCFKKAQAAGKAGPAKQPGVWRRLWQGIKKGFKRLFGKKASKVEPKAVGSNPPQQPAAQQPPAAPAKTVKQPVTQKTEERPASEGQQPPKGLSKTNVNPANKQTISGEKSGTRKPATKKKSTDKGKKKPTGLQKTVGELAEKGKKTADKKVQKAPTATKVKKESKKKTSLQKTVSKLAEKSKKTAVKKAEEKPIAKKTTTDKKAQKKPTSVRKTIAKKTGISAEQERIIAEQEAIIRDFEALKGGQPEVFAFQQEMFKRRAKARANAQKKKSASKRKGNTR